MRRLTITAIASGMLVAVPAQAIEPADYQGVAAALAQYKSAMEKRDLTGVEALFAPDGQIFESGGVEGNFAHYRDHHLGPELKEFKSFTFRNYKISVRSEGDVAIATETYSRSEEQTSELQSLMRISYAVFCLKKKTNIKTNTTQRNEKSIK